MLIVRAGLDNAALNAGIDAFAKLAGEVGAGVTLVHHDRGHHGFEVIDATQETAAVMDKVLAFLDERLAGPKPARRPGR
jgi:hypothetical protein